MDVKILNRKGHISYEVLVEHETKLIFSLSSTDSPSFIIGFICAGQWIYQSLMWSCRGGKQKYYRAMVCMYRFLRRNKITPHTMRYLAWGENRLKHGGIAIRHNHNVAADEVSGSGIFVPEWKPSYSRWRHGGWYVRNVIYPNGAMGCVSNNYPDNKWRIACDDRCKELGGDGDFTFPSRDAAARAEFELAKNES